MIKLFKRPKNTGIVGVYQHLDSLLSSIKQAQEQKLPIIDVYTPVPNHDIEQLVLPKRSPVRFATFAGAATGLIGGMALAIWSSLIWNMIVAGKPVVSIPPFTVVGFEFTILIGAIFTFLALLFLAKLPYIYFPTKAYRPEFSKDRFGLWLDPPQEKIPQVKDMLTTQGAVEVFMVEREVQQ